MRVEISAETIDDVVAECGNWSMDKLSSRRDIQQLVGLLQHIAKCVKPARRFMNRVLTALRNAPFNGRHWVLQELILDIGWFLQYTKNANGIVLLPAAQRPEWWIECDSSLRRGGAFSNTLVSHELYAY